MARGERAAAAASRDGVRLVELGSARLRLLVRLTRLVDRGCVAACAAADAAAPPAPPTATGRLAARRRGRRLRLYLACHSSSSASPARRGGVGELRLEGTISLTSAPSADDERRRSASAAAARHLSDLRLDRPQLVRRARTPARPGGAPRRRSTRRASPRGLRVGADLAQLRLQLATRSRDAASASACSVRMLDVAPRAHLVRGASACACTSPSRVANSLAPAESRCRAASASGASCASRPDPRAHLVLRPPERLLTALRLATHALQLRVLRGGRHVARVAHHLVAQR